MIGGSKLMEKSDNGRPTDNGRLLLVIRNDWRKIMFGCASSGRRSSVAGCLSPVVSSSYLCKMEKKASESLVIMTELVLPNDTNNFGNLMGGRLMYWMDIAAALAAMKHCAAPVVTASVDNISFENPIKIGNVVHIEAKVTRAFSSSMEVHMKVWGEDAIQQYRYKSNEAYYTFCGARPKWKSPAR